MLLNFHVFCKGGPSGYHRILLMLHVFCKGYPLEFRGDLAYLADFAKGPAIGLGRYSDFGPRFF